MNINKRIAKYLLRCAAMKALKAIQEKYKTQTCPTFRYFGAPYPDAICHEGNLCDADDSDEPGTVNVNENYDPCPFCHTLDAMKRHDADPPKFLRWIKSIQTF